MLKYMTILSNVPYINQNFSLLQRNTHFHLYIMLLHFPIPHTHTHSLFLEFQFIYFLSQYPFQPTGKSSENLSLAKSGTISMQYVPCMPSFFLLSFLIASIMNRKVENSSNESVIYAYFIRCTPARYAKRINVFCYFVIYFDQKSEETKLELLNQQFFFISKRRNSSNPTNKEITCKHE